MNRASWILLGVLVLAVGGFLTWRAMRPGSPPPVMPASVEPSQPAVSEPAPPPVLTPEAASAADAAGGTRRAVAGAG